MVMVYGMLEQILLRDEMQLYKSDGFSIFISNLDLSLIFTICKWLIFIFIYGNNVIIIIIIIYLR